LILSVLKGLCQDYSDFSNRLKNVILKNSIDKVIAKIYGAKLELKKKRAKTFHFSIVLAYKGKYQ
jgi:hypothetical protein